MDTVSDLEMQLLPTKTEEAVEYPPSEKFKQYIPQALKYLSRNVGVEKSIPVSGSVARIAHSKSRVVVSTSGNEVYLLSDDMNSLRQLGNHYGRITQILITEDEKYAITSSTDNSIKIFLLDPPEEQPQTEAQEEQQEQPSDAQEVQESQEGQEGQEQEAPKTDAPEEESKTEAQEDQPDQPSDAQEVQESQEVKEQEPVKTVWELKENSDWVNDIRIAPDGNTLYSCSDDRKVNIWDLSEKTCKETLYEERSYIRSMDFDSDFRYMVTGHSSNDVCVWDLNEKKVVNVLEGHGGTVNHVKFTPNNNYIVSGADDSNLILWSFESRSKLAVLSGHTASIGMFLITQDSKYIISITSSEKVIKIWNIEEKKLEANLQGHNDYVTYVQLSPDEKYIISTSADKTICVWNIQDFSLLANLAGHSSKVNVTAIIKDNLLLSGGDDDCLKVWTYKRESSKCLESGGNNIRSIQTYEDHRHFYTVDNHMCIKHWDRRTKTFEELLPKQDGSEAYSMILSKDKKRLIIGCSNNIQIFDIETRKIVDTLENGYEVTCLALSDDNKTLFVGGYNFNIYDVATKTQLGDCSSGHGGSKIVTIRISKDQTFFVTFSYDRTIKIWDFAKREVKMTLEGHTDWVTGGFLIKEDKYLVSISDDRSIRIWNLTTGLEEIKLEGHQNYIRSCAISTDENYFVTGDTYGNVFIWDFMTRTQIKNLKISSNTVSQIKFTTDNQYLLMYSDYENFEIVDTRDLFLNNSIRKANTDEEISLRGIKEVFLSSYYTKFIIKKTESTYQPWMNNICVWPYKFNVLYFFAYSNEHQKFKIALEAGAPLMEDIYGVTPITISLDRNTTKCFDEMLKYIVKLHQVADPRADVYLKLVTKDITQVILSGSRYLPQLLKTLFVTVEDAELPSFAVPRFNLPYTTLQPIPEIRKETFINESDNGEGILVEYKGAKFAWNFEPGSTESLEFLKAVIDSPNTAIYTTPLIKSIIDLKWNNLWNINFALTIIYWISLGVLVSLVYDDHNLYLNIAFIVLNAFFLGYELFQGVALGSDYFVDAWNYIDLGRGIMCIMWSVSNVMMYTNQYLEWVVALLCWIRGLTYFRAFTYTRYYVRMILEVAKDTASFFIILLYSTFAFAVLYSISTAGRNLTLVESISKMYELDMGAFSTEGYDLLDWICFVFTSIVNIIIMLNLLISILGDAFSRVSEKADEADATEMLHIIIELETLMVWKRNSGTRNYLQKVDVLEEKVENLALEAEVKNLQRYIKLLDQKLINKILDVKDQMRINKKDSDIKSDTLADHLVLLKKHTADEIAKSDSELEKRLENQLSRFEEKLKVVSSEQQDLLQQLEKKILAGVAEKMFSGLGAKLGGL